MATSSSSAPVLTAQAQPLPLQTSPRAYNGFGGSLLPSSPSPWAASAPVPVADSGHLSSVQNSLKRLQMRSSPRVGTAQGQRVVVSLCRAGTPVTSLCAQPGCCGAKGKGKGTSKGYVVQNVPQAQMQGAPQAQAQIPSPQRPRRFTVGAPPLVLSQPPVPSQPLPPVQPLVLSQPSLPGPSAPPLYVTVQAASPTVYVAGAGMPTMPQWQSPPPQALHVEEAGCGVRRLRREGEAKDAKLGAVIVTIVTMGHSYDDLFEKVQQQGPAGTVVATYVAQGQDLPLLVQALKSQGQLGTALLELPQEAVGMIETALTGSGIAQLCQDMKAVDAASVVFNWECCSGCTDCSFGKESAVVLELMELLLNRGHMVMCSDFSLKALIREWSEQRLGPNPFVQLGGFGGQMTLCFDPAVLKKCPSAQLQKVGEMCDDGEADVKALADTIVYTVNQDRLQGHERYRLEVLSVATKLRDNLPANLSCKVGEKQGTAGHVLLRYPTGGLLLASAGHWLELVNVNVSEERLIEVASRTYGPAYSAGLSQMLATSVGAQRTMLTQTIAQQVIQQSSPSTYSTV